MVTGPVGERLQAGTEDAPVLACPAPLGRFHDCGAGLTYLLPYNSYLSRVLADVASQRPQARVSQMFP